MWYKQKTTWTGIVGIVAAIGGFFTDEIGVAAMIAGVVGSFGLIFGRQAIAKVIPMMLVILVVGGCTFSYNPKYQEIKPNAFPFMRPPSSTAEVEGQATETPGEEMILPDGSYFTTSGGGSAGNFWLILMQNDGTSQEARGSASAAVTAQSPGATTGSTTAAEGATGTTTTTSDDEQPTE